MMLLENAPAQQPSTASSLLTLILPLVLLGLVFYFFIFRPQKKQERETTNMRNSLEIGDVIVTTGGIVGMVVKIKDDMLLIETGGDRTKIQIQKWAISSIIEKINEPEPSETDKKVVESKDEKERRELKEKKAQEKAEKKERKAKEKAERKANKEKEK